MPKRLVRDWETGGLMEVRVPVEELPEGERPPFLLVPALKRGDLITFEMGPVKLTIRVMDPATATVVPCQWRWMRGLMELHGAVNPEDQEMAEMTVIEGWAVRLGHPDNAKCFIDLAPAERILLNGRPIK